MKWKCVEACDAPDKIDNAEGKNLVCSHVTFSWKKPKSEKEILQYQIAIMEGSGNFRELPAILGSYDAYRVSNMDLMRMYGLQEDSAVKFKIRAGSECGWGQWSDWRCSLNPTRRADDTDSETDPDDVPPGGAMCPWGQAWNKDTLKCEED